MNKYCNNSWRTVVDVLKTDIYKGLTEKESKIRKRKFGNNIVELPKSNNGIKVYVKPLFRLYILIELISCIFLLLNKRFLFAYIVLAIFIINISKVLKDIRKVHKESQLLLNLNKATCTVLRDRREKIIMSSDVVRGDIIYFKKDSLIAADIRIIEAKDIKVDEKNITGENFLKDKYESKINSSVSNLGEMHNILFKGSVIKEGEGFGVAIEIGNSTQLGKLLSMLTHANTNKHGLGQKIEKNLGKVMAILCIAAISLFFIFNKYESSLNNMMVQLFIISSIPVKTLISISSYLLKKDLNKEGIELINMSTLQYINDLEIIFLDKVGAITQEKVIVSKAYVNNKIYEEEELDYKEDEAVKRLIDISLLSNNAFYNIDNDTGVGQLIDVAYLRLAARKKAYKSVIDSKHIRLFDILMDSQEQIFTTVNKHKNGFRANTRGNVDIILEKCTHIFIDGAEREILEQDKKSIKGINYNFSTEGLTVEALAFRNFSYKPSPSENIESNLIFIGLMAHENLFVDSVRDQIEDIRSRGIVPILFTEDNIISATTIGNKAGFIKDSSGVISGVELDSLTKEELINVLEKVRVFSRVNPEIKSKIIGLFTKDNYNVAVAGETLGDVPSISLAKVGIGKGKAPKAVKKVCDVFIRENYMNGFLKLFDISRDFKKGISRELNIVFFIILSQILIINITSTTQNQDISILSVIILNLIILGPLSIFIIRTTHRDAYIKKYFLRFLMWVAFGVVATSMGESSKSAMFLLCSGSTLIGHLLIDSKKFINKLNKDTLLIAISTLAIIFGGVLIFFISNTKINLLDFLILFIIFIINVLFELFMKKWK